MLLNSEDTNKIAESKDIEQTKTEEEFVGTYDSENNVYYLHKSKIETPKQDECHQAQSIALKNLTASEIEY